MNDRPIECSNCKRPIKIIYKEVNQNGLSEIHMCDECPILQYKLQGSQSSPEGSPEEKAEEINGLHCGACGTSYDAIHAGNPLGCSECYVIFEDLITRELITADKIGSRVHPTVEMKSSSPLHIGKSPNQPKEVALSKRLQELNEALNDALKRENYEQAAWLRDQIKEITEKPHE
ncbi:MAG: hypothetical protein Tsb0015_13730 [Simkaniaceae bacterium]